MVLWKLLILEPLLSQRSEYQTSAVKCSHLITDLWRFIQNKSLSSGILHWLFKLIDGRLRDRSCMRPWDQPFGALRGLDGYPLNPLIDSTPSSQLTNDLQMAGKPVSPTQHIKKSAKSAHLSEFRYKVF